MSQNEKPYTPPTIPVDRLLQAHSNLETRLTEILASEVAAFELETGVLISLVELSRKTPFSTTPQRFTITLDLFAQEHLHAIAGRIAHQNEQKRLAEIEHNRKSSPAQSVEKS